jgi:hypothetical protein
LIVRFVRMVYLVCMKKHEELAVAVPLEPLTGVPDTFVELPTDHLICVETLSDAELRGELPAPVIGHGRVSIVTEELSNRDELLGEGLAP